MAVRLLPSLSSKTRARFISNAYQAFTGEIHELKGFQFKPEDLNRARANGAPVYTLASGRIRSVFMDREKDLNTLTLDMINHVGFCLEAYARNTNNHAVILRAHRGSPAFATAPDLPLLYKAGFEDFKMIREYYHKLYTLVNRGPNLDKPYIPFLDGIASGAGAALWMHANFKVASPSAIVSFPETGFGYFPDSGITYYLRKLKYNLGMYYALTGQPIKAEDFWYTRLATHYSFSAMFEGFQDSMDAQAYMFGVVEDMLDSIHTITTSTLEMTVKERPEKWHLTPHLDDIDSCFSRDSVEDIMKALLSRDTEFTRQTHALLLRKSPLSLKVTFRKMKESSLDFPNQLKQDYVTMLRFMKSPDYYQTLKLRNFNEVTKEEADFEVNEQGTKKFYQKALLPRADQRAIGVPQRIEDVTSSMVDPYFTLDKDEIPLHIKGYDDDSFSDKVTPGFKAYRQLRDLKPQYYDFK